MSRVIKFRSWDNHREEYLSAGNVFIPVHPSKAPKTCSKLNLDTSNFLCAEGRMMLEQSTGLQDKNGKDIYEGDILAGGRGYSNGAKQPNHIVEWTNKTHWSGMADGYTVHHSGFNIDEYHITLDECEVIGNIHQNPELLK